MPILRRRNRRPSSFEFSKRVGVGVSRAKLPRAKETQIISRWLEVEGKLTGIANLQIDGRVRGRVELKGYKVTVTARGRVTADVVAENVVVAGRIDGHVVAEDKVEVLAGGVVQGDVCARQVVLADGAVCNGRVDRSYDSLIEWSRPVEIDRPLAAPSRPMPAGVPMPRVGHDPREKAIRSTRRDALGWTFVDSESPE